MQSCSLSYIFLHLKQNCCKHTRFGLIRSFGILRSLQIIKCVQYLFTRRRRFHYWAHKAQTADLLFLITHDRTVCYIISSYVRSKCRTYINYEARMLSSDFNLAFSLFDYRSTPDSWSVPCIGNREFESQKVYMEDWPYSHYLSFRNCVPRHITHIVTRIT